MSDTKIKVAVIGAGAAGLCCAKHLADEPNRFDFVVFEQQDCVGGTWKFSEKTDTDDYGLPIHSSMYENLRTNLPKESMAFPDFPFSDCDGKSFLHHTAVQKYLEDYAEHYSLCQYIKFHSLVINVQPINPSVSDPKWFVTVRNVTLNEETTETFDSVMVCNGHYSVPYVPTLPGIEDFEGTLIHSHVYRNNEVFEDKSVVVLGAGASGIDIAIEVADAAKEVIMSHNLPLRTCPLPENMSQEVGIAKICKGSVIFQNDRKYHCDAVLLCTGYLYTYPFLHKDCQMMVGDQRVQPLYKHLFHIYYPSLAIWAVPKQILPFPIYDQQVKVVLKYLKGAIQLPSQSDMLRDESDDFQSRLSRGMKPRHAHVMSGAFQWDYDDAIAQLGHVPPISEVVRKLFKHTHAIRKQDVLNYKNNNFKIVDEENFVQIFQ